LQLNGVLESTRCVIQEHWQKQLLHVLVQSDDVMRVLQDTFLTLPAEMRANTTVLVTVVSNADWIFFGRRNSI
jgi:hypothetical protein